VTYHQGKGSENDLVWVGLGKYLASPKRTLQRNVKEKQLGDNPLRWLADEL
jgi:hypothetical protein